ncbi:UNVERIFIED_CONTAM: hypothetical protein FKN15_051121 [Acipenser sinensis]
MQALTSSTFCEPRRHRCILGHLHDHYNPHDHYLLDQSVPKLQRHVSFQDDEEDIVRINPRERTWLTGYEDYRHAAVREKCIETEDMDSYVHFTKSEASKHDYNYPYVPNSDSGLSKDLKRSSSVVNTQPLSLKSKSRWRKEDGERSRCKYCRDMFNHEVTLVLVIPAMTGSVSGGWHLSLCPSWLHVCAVICHCVHATTVVSHAGVVVGSIKH